MSKSCTVIICRQCRTTLTESSYIWYRKRPHCLTCIIELKKDTLKKEEPIDVVITNESKIEKGLIKGLEDALEYEKGKNNES